MRQKIAINIGALLFITNIVFTSGCEKFVETDKPANKVTAKEAWANNLSAAGVLTKLYSDMSSSTVVSGKYGISYLTGLLSDELQLFNNDPNLLPFYKNSLQSTNTNTVWPSFYNYIYTCNDACENLPNSKGVSSEVRNQLLGEAKFVRAFCYFYLVNLFGDVPLVTSTNYAENRLAGRSSATLVYQQIKSDLLEAKTLLSKEYKMADASSPSTERVRPNAYAATALLARVYLYTREYKNAEENATEVIQYSDYELSRDLTSCFSATSRESIWQLQTVDPSRNTKEGDVYILIGLPDDASPSALSQSQIAAFEANDQRFLQWTKEFCDGGFCYRFPFKYKIGRNIPEPQPREEYLMVLRLGEQYLIRAEARANQGNLKGVNSAETDINAIRNRAGLANTLAVTQQEILSAIGQERRVELFSEWADRWTNLKRTGNIDKIMGLAAPIKGSSWSSFKSLLPIPFESIQNAPGMKGSQNPGY